MANTFKNSKARLTGTSPVSLLTAPAGSNQYVLIGATLCNRLTTVIKVDLFITDTGGDTYLVDDVEVPPGATLVPIGGEQKIALTAGDVVKVKSDTAASLDTILSYLEVTP